MLYRYMSYEKFKDLVETKSLLFVNPLTMWKNIDKNEGIIYQVAQTKKGRFLIESVIREKNQSEDIIQEMLKLFENGCINSNCVSNGNKTDWFGLRCQSWCLRNKDVEVQKKIDKTMWENPVFGSEVCIGVERCKFDALSYFDDRVEGFIIKYIKYPENDEEWKNVIGNIVGKGGVTYYPAIFKYKDVRFENESEFRFYVKGFPCRECARVSIKIDICNFIDIIYIKPNSSCDDIEKIKKLCGKYNLLGKIETIL